MNKKVYLFFVFLLFSFSVICAYTLPESYASGEVVGAVTGRELSLGGMVVMGEEWLNPALIAGNKGFKVSITGGFVKTGERRKKSLFDSFDNRIGDVTVADNSNVFSEPTCVSVSYFSPLRLGVGFHFLPFVDFDYKYTREMRDDFYILKETINDEGKGKIYLSSFTAAYEIVKDRLSIGFGIDLFNGKREWNYTEEYVDPSIDDIHNKFSQTLRGNTVTAGVLLRPLLRIRLGGFVSTKAMLGDDKENDLPFRFGGGMEIIPPNELPALFVVDAIFEQWNSINNNYADVIKLHMGVEHQFSMSMKGRFGFGYETSYLSSDIPKVFFTSGVGFVQGGLTLDAGINVAKRDYSANDVATGQRDMDGVSSISESLIKFLVSVTYRR
ncbi:MAG: hypothetical protein B5M53_07725 [Candidatus Cloacimonas sp. 4484_209]|nr:MAG: hypothetical protein B5M53_07725 [Candidatus Cloacimonas sp. 4484_209]